MPPDYQRAALIIQRCWIQGTVIDRLPDDCLPSTPEEGYAIQASLGDERAEPLAGWKIAATAAAGRAHINVDRPLAGRLFDSIVYASGAEVPFGENRMAVAECEFAFTLGSDLVPRATPYTTDEVANAVESLHAGLEFPDSRFTDFTVVGTAGLIADNACARQFVLGEATSWSFDMHALDQAKTRLLINDVEVTCGQGVDALGGPLDALTWLVNTLSNLGITLEAGQFVTTGVTGQPSAIQRGDRVTADLGAFGSVSATLT